MNNTYYEQGRLVCFDDYQKKYNLFYFKTANNFPWSSFTEIANEFKCFSYESLRCQALIRRKRNNKDNICFDFNVDKNSSVDGIDNSSKYRRLSKAGRRPFHFWPTFRAFVMSRFMRVENSVKDVCFLLENNPTFADACGFNNSVPSYRSLARFDQIMSNKGLWAKTRRLVVELNLKNNVFSLEETIAVDTTHVEAESVPVPKDSEQKPTCDNVGVMRKSKTVTHIAHKISIIGFPKSDLPLIGTVHPGGMPDNATLKPSLEQLIKEYPRLTNLVEDILADGIYQTKDNHEIVELLFGEGTRLVAPINPRNHKDKILTDVPGITIINKYGCPKCISGHKMFLLSRDLKRDQYIWGCPVFNSKFRGKSVTCPKASHAICCNCSKNGRVFRTNRHDYPQIHWEYPQHSLKHIIEYRQRSSSERINSTLKEGFGFSRVHKQNKSNVEAHVDKCIAAVHIVAYMAHFLGKPELMRSWSKIMVA